MPEDKDPKIVPEPFRHYVPDGRELPDSTKTSNIVISLKQLEGPRVAGLLYFEVKNERSEVYNIRRSVKRGTSIEIDHDLIIRFRLDDDFAWEWSIYPFTLKNPRHTRYYKVVPSTRDTREFDLHVKKGNNSNGESHACFFNVVMAQPFGAPIEISFDPDVKNPPPPPELGGGRETKDGYIVPEGVSVPI